MFGSSSGNTLFGASQPAAGGSLFGQTSPSRLLGAPSTGLFGTSKLTYSIVFVALCFVKRRLKILHYSDPPSNNLRGSLGRLATRQLEYLAAQHPQLLVRVFLGRLSRLLPLSVRQPHRRTFLAQALLTWD